MNAHPPFVTFAVTVEHDLDTGLWIASNDEIPFAVEAESYDAMIEAAWVIAPQMIAENNIPVASPLRLAFVMDTSRPLQAAP